MTVREFLKQDITIDVMGSLTEEWLLAFVGPVTLTEYGERYFAEILDNQVDISNDTAEVDTYTNEEDYLASRLFRYAAGYCSEETFDKLFVDEDEQEEGSEVGQRADDVEA